MPQVINTNISSLTAQRNLNMSQSTLATSLQRLSSGLRINSAKDDAAGLAISERMTTQIRGTNQAIRNANDGISLAQTSEGALAELTQSLQRVRELAVQAANATNSASDRAALNLEVQQRLAEIDRISSQTSFNGRKILDGSFGSAAFQIGAEVGQTISLDLQSSTRVSDIGKIADITSQALGATATGGSISLGSISNFDFSAAGTTDGGVTLSAASFLFGNTASLGSGGSLSVTNVGALTDFTGANAHDGLNVQTPNNSNNFDYTGAIAQFDVTVGATTVGITLTTDYTDINGLATEIQNQLQAVDGNFAVNVNGGNLEISLAGDTNAVQISNVDANSANAGFVASSGYAGGGTDAETFDIDNISISLSANYGSNNGVASAIQTQLNATAGPGAYTVGWNAGTSAYDIVNNTIGSTAPTILATNTAAYQDGWDTTANLTFTDGTPAVSANSITFDVDGNTITLDKDFTSFTDLSSGDAIDSIQAQLDTLTPAGTYTVTNTANAIKIVKTDGSAPVAITATGTDPVSDARAAAAGFGPVTGAFSGAASFKVDGQTVTLNTPTTDLAGLASAITGQLSGYTASAVDTDNDTVADTLKITNDTTGSAAVAITNADANAIAAGITNGTGIAGVGSGSITLASGDFAIAIGDGTAKDFAGTYASASELATAINRDMSGVSATITSSGALQLMSSDTITLSGNEAGPSGSFAFANLVNEANSGSLSGASVLNVSSSNETMVRIDSALTTISNLRSTFGAIQNRFESTISNLTTSAENLTAARSRIQDADFAQETAALTRAQILQQAGVAMLAQANALPQQVLKLLQ